VVTHFLKRLELIYRNFDVILRHSTPSVSQGIGNEEPQTVEYRCDQEAVAHSRILALQSSRYEAPRSNEDRQKEKDSLDWLWCMVSIERSIEWGSDGEEPTITAAGATLSAMSASRSQSCPDH
jgi:hypothetical protein